MKNSMQTNTQEVTLFQVVSTKPSVSYTGNIYTA